MDDSLTLATFIEGWPLFRESALAGALAGTLLGVLGVYVVLRRMVFLTAAVSQSASLGITGAFYVQIHLGLGAVASPTLGAGLVTLLAIGLVMGRRRKTPPDALLGLIYLVGAAGTLAVATRIVQEMHDVQTLLFGTAVAVVPEAFTELWMITAALLTLHLIGWRGFSAVSFDPDGARVRGLPVRTLEWTLFVTLALAISVCTRILGALPTFAFSVLPAMAAVRLVPNVPRALILSGLIGGFTGFGGYVVAFLYALPVGAAQALVGAVVVAVAAGVALALPGRRAPRPVAEGA